jgi:hypothetical protein
MTEQNNKKANEFYAVYEEYSKTLRTWFVAYGIGGPLLFLSNEKLWVKITNSGEARIIGICFLAGVAAQVILSCLNKTLMWALYYGEVNPPSKRHKRYKIADWLSEQMWIDFAVDVFTLVVLAIATTKSFVIVL